MIRYKDMDTAEKAVHVAELLADFGQVVRVSAYPFPEVMTALNLFVAEMIAVFVKKEHRDDAVKLFSEDLPECVEVLKTLLEGGVKPHEVLSKALADHLRDKLSPDKSNGGK